MKFKLDENFGTRTQHLFEETGHDLHTVPSEGLQGATDELLYEICCNEQRCLITLDLDFSDVTRFPPEKAAGIVVLRLPRTPSLSILEGLARQFLDALNTMSVEKRLWIVEVGRVRIHQTETDDLASEDAP